MALIDEACRHGARKSSACSAMGIASRTFQRWQKGGTLKDGRKGAEKTVHNKLAEQERLDLLAEANKPEHRDLPACKIIPALADKGKYIASERSLYRYLKDDKQSEHRSRNKKPTSRKPKSLTASKPNQVWSWDITYLISTVKGRYFYLYLIMDVYSRCIVGWSIHDAENSSHASKLMRKTCFKEGVSEHDLVLHSDNGSPMKGATMLATLEKLGVAASFSRPSVSNDNAYSESLFRTLKYCNGVKALKPFDTINEADAWVASFVHWYNDRHLHSAIKYVTPSQRHKGLDRALLLQRDEVYQAARARHPERWGSRSTRNWDAVASVVLNPQKESKVKPDGGERDALMHKPIGQGQPLHQCA